MAVLLDGNNLLKNKEDMCFMTITACQTNVSLLVQFGFMYNLFKPNQNISNLIQSASFALCTN